MLRTYLALLFLTGCGATEAITPHERQELAALVAQACTADTCDGYVELTDGTVYLVMRSQNGPQLMEGGSFGFHPADPPHPRYVRRVARPGDEAYGRLRSEFERQRGYG